MSIFINHIEGSKADQVESFDKDQIRIGRQSDNDLKFDPQKDISVSGYHAEIYRDGDKYFIKDLQSRNGTFVNSRKIDRPIALKEGDLVQFSARGPKIAFFTKDPALEGEALVAETPENAPTQIFTPEEAKEKKASSQWKSHIKEKVRPLLLIAGLTTGTAGLFGIGYYLGYSWWILLITAAMTLFVGGSGYLGWRWWKRRKAVTEQKKGEHQEREASLGRGSRDNLQDLRHKWTEVLRSLKESKLQRHVDDPVYALPWFLLVGEPGCGKSTFVKAGGPQSSVVTLGGDGPTRNCDWWFFDKLVVVDTSGRYVFQAKESDAAGEWHAFLSQLRNNRRREPLNGVIVVLPADAVISRPIDKLKEQAAKIRELLDDMVRSLGVKFPVYLMISKSDLITGFNEFFEALPDQVKGQALGYVNADAVNNSDASRFFDRAFRTLYTRAERLRLAVLNEGENPEFARRVFLFPAELKSLQAPLKSFVDVLFRPSPYRDAPFFRSMFWVSARRFGTPVSRLSRMLGLSAFQAAPSGVHRDVFVRDLFSPILPNDRVLVGHTALSRERRRLTRFAALTATVAGSLLLCGVFTMSFTNNWQALSRLNIEPCTTSEAVTGFLTQVLRPLDDCRERVESVTPRTFWKKVAFDFGLGQSNRVGEALRERYLAEFRAKVLAPIDARIDQSLSSGSANALVVSLIIQRIERLRRCQQEGRCGDHGETVGISYQTMLAVGQSQVVKEGDPAIERLKRTNESYLTWQTDPVVLKEIYSKDLSRIRNWSRRGTLTEEWVLESTQPQFAPIRASDMWGIPSNLKVDGAYTARAWREGISPLISGLQSMAKDRDFVAALKMFHQNYRSRALSQWENFFAKFPDVENSLSSAAINRVLGAKVLGPDSPYNRVIEMGNENLSVVLEENWQGNKLEPWAAMLKRYVRLRAKIQPRQEAKQDSKQEKDEPQDEQAIKFLKMFFDAVGEFRSDFGAPDRAFKSAQKAFQEGAVSSAASHPLLKATWVLRALKDEIGSRRGEDEIFWILLEKPLDLAWRAMLAETARQLQEQWNKLRLGIRNQQDFGVVSERIYGFATDGPAAPFLQKGDRWMSRPLLNQSVQFTNHFLYYLSRLRHEARLKLTELPPTSNLEPPRDIVRTN